jgi:hypothetical protein
MGSWLAQRYYAPYTASYRFRNAPETQGWLDSYDRVRASMALGAEIDKPLLFNVPFKGRR